MHKFILSFIFMTQLCYGFDWQGHRGARGLYPENTTGGMKVALSYPITTLELDVVISKDLKVVVSHEPWMSHKICLAPKEKKIKGKEYKIYHMNYEEVVKFDCGSLPLKDFPEQVKIAEGKPTLENLLSTTEDHLKKLKNRTVNYSIEIKSSLEFEKTGLQPNYKKFSDLVISSIQRYLPLNRFYIQSFDWRVLKYIHKKYPKIKLVALKYGKFDPKSALNELGFRPAVFSPYFEYLKPEHVKLFHDHNVKVIVWTSNEIQEFKRLIQMGVDGIITDYPNLISKVDSLECGKQETFFEGKCIPLPAHSLPSDSIPGWTCRPGYVQKWKKCIKIKIPKHAHLSPDGKSWICDPGFKRYRSKCIKK